MSENSVDGSRYKAYKKREASTPPLLDIEELHLDALSKGSMTYKDPATGFTVFTELAHLKRTTCCGNKCRHCPYGWSNVRNETEGKGAKLASGDKRAARALMEQIADMNKSSTSAKEMPHDKTPGKGGRKGGRLTSKNVPYTRGGDKGTSQLLTGERRSKADDAFEAMGTVDELCSVVGVVHAELSDSDHDYGELEDWILDVMSRLFDIGSHVAKPQKHSNECDEEASDGFSADGVGGGFHAAHVDILEDWIDSMTEQLPELTSFILPTGCKAAAQLHVARTVCRRAERRVVVLGDNVYDPNAVRYLNRLSDFFFCAARYANFCQDREEIQYRRDYRGANQRNRVTVSLHESSGDNDS